MCSGQHLDLITPQPNLEQWQQIAAAKSGVFFRLACWGGAALAIDRFEALESYGEFGFRLGLLLQLQDDLGDMQQAKAGQGDALISDNIERCLPIAYAREVLPPDKKIHLGVLLSQGAQDPVAAGSVIDLLDQCGADLYVLTEIERHMRLGIEALQSAGPRQPAGDTLAELLRHLGNGAFANS